MYTKNVILSLFTGTLFGVFILHGFDFFASFEAAVILFKNLLSEPWIVKTLLFVILVGSIMELIERSGGVGGFIDFALHKKKFVQSPRSALMLSYMIGVFIFIETSITALIAGAVGKPFCDKYKIPHAKLAFVCDSTSAPIGSLIVINGYGMLLLGLITTQISHGLITADAIDVLFSAVLHNFYSMSALLVTFVFIWFNLNIGPMRHVEYKKSLNYFEGKVSSMYLMVLPILLMLGLIFVFLYITGDGNILKGSGSSSILYTMITTLVFMFFYYISTKTMSVKEWSLGAYVGGKKLLIMAYILIFAFSIGEVTTELKTGVYLASLANENLNVIFLAGVVFLLSSAMSFATGTSWGTFSIMIPIAVPMSVAIGGDISIVIGAVISGGIFGDHCSPISDTTIISSLAADCDVVEHVKTQLPYALLSGIIAFVLFVIFSLF